jgi:Tol biopolymer transport system component/predicted Ser/Thr protein kinase
MIGQTISHYRITNKLGEGGMGVVYKAEDTKLLRTVALKFLSPKALGSDADKERFLREAQAAGILDHPNIATVYEIDESEGHVFMAMAYVDGPSLAAKIADRPMKIGEALDVAIQIAEGLQEAHEKGIVHRDIKSANILLTKKGQARITDFGLAYLAGRSKLTKSGTTLGTPAYMSPEQAQGHPTDRRSDIWSLGVVLYEMLTGRLPFDGQYEQAIVYSIINENPEPVTALRSGLPLELDRIVYKALAKRPEERYQHADDLTVDLRRLRKQLNSTESSAAHAEAMAPEVPELSATAAFIRATSPARPVVRPRRLVVVFLAALLVAAIGVIALLLLRREEGAAPKTVRRYSMQLGNVRPVISPNGRHIAYRAEEKLWIRDLDSEVPREIPGGQGPGAFYSDSGYYLTWSPDSQALAFPMGKEIRRVSVGQGGTAATICQLPEGRDTGRLVGGMDWSSDGRTIVFSRYSAGVFEVPATGGSPVLLRKEDHADDIILVDGPGGRTILYAAQHDVGHMLVALSPQGERRELAEINSGWPELNYSATGHILYRANPRETPSLWALPISPDGMQATGKPFLVVRSGVGASLSNDGTLVYLDGGGLQQQDFSWRDARGAIVEPLEQPHGLIDTVSLSADGTRLLLTASDAGRRGAWVHDLGRQTKERIPLGPADGSRPNPINAHWNGPRHVICTTLDPVAGGPPETSVYALRLESTDKPQTLLTKQGFQVATDVTRDGRYLVFIRWPAGGIWYAELGPDGLKGEPIEFSSGGGKDSSAFLSPNDRYVAYCSTESGRDEVYVRPFPAGAGKWQISHGGGSAPLWGAKGSELYYSEGVRLMRVAVSTGAEFSAGSPEPLFEHPNLSGGPTPYPRYAVSPDGKRFLTIESERDMPEPLVRLVENWFTEFQGNAAGAR